MTGRLAEAFVYLAVVIDAFSRKVVGWALDDHLEARLAVDALERRSPRATRRPASSITPIAASSTLRANMRRGSTGEAFSAA